MSLKMEDKIEIIGNAKKKNLESDVPNPRGTFIMIFYQFYLSLSLPNYHHPGLSSSFSVFIFYYIRVDYFEYFLLLDISLHF